MSTSHGTGNDERPQTETGQTDAPASGQTDKPTSGSKFRYAVLASLPILLVVIAKLAGIYVRQDRNSTMDEEEFLRQFGTTPSDLSEQWSVDRNGVVITEPTGSQPTTGNTRLTSGSFVGEATTPRPVAVRPPRRDSDLLMKSTESLRLFQQYLDSLTPAD